MELEIIKLGNLLIEKYNIKSGLFPAYNGQIFIDHHSQPIITSLNNGDIFLTLEDGLKKILLNEQGVLVYKNQQITILLQQN